MAFASDILFSIDTALQLKGAVNVETLTSSTKDLEYSDSTVQILEAHASGDLKLPAAKSGVIFVLCNTSGSNALEIKIQSGSLLISLAANNAGSPAASTAICYCDGTNWHAQVLTSHTAAV